MFQKPHFWGAVLAGAVLLFAIGFYATDGEDAAPVTEADSATTEFAPLPADAQELAAGIDYIVTGPGEGEKFSDDYVTYKMDMYLADGRQVMSSSEQGGSYTQPMSMLQQMVPGIASALADMQVGESRRYWIEPENLAPGYPGMASKLHVIDFTLVGGRSALPAPDNVATPPEDASKTDSGIAWIVLEEGPEDETAHPALEDTVKVHYTGWTTDGKMFDSSELRGEPANFPLGRLIAGWQQGIPLMTRGDRFRFWIPEELAYGNSTRPGAPQGMLVFDIELLDFSSPAATGEATDSDSGEDDG